MNTATATLFVLSLGAIATAYCIKKKAAKISIANDTQVLQLEQDGYYCEDMDCEYDIYSMFYSPLQKREPVRATFTGNLKTA